MARWPFQLPVEENHCSGPGSIPPLGKVSDTSCSQLQRLSHIIFYCSHSCSNRFYTSFNQLLHRYNLTALLRACSTCFSCPATWCLWFPGMKYHGKPAHTHNLMNICFPVFIKVDGPVMHFVKPYSLPVAANLISHPRIGSPFFLIHPLYPLLLPITFPNKLLANKTSSHSLLFGPLRWWQKVRSLNQQSTKLRMGSKNSASTFGLMTEVSPATSPWFPDSWVIVMGETAPNMGFWFKVYCILWVYTNLSGCDLPTGTTESLLQAVTIKLEKNLSSSSACSFHVLSTTFLHLVFEAGNCNPPHPSACLIHRMVSKRNLKNGDRKRM